MATRRSKRTRKSELVRWYAENLGADLLDIGEIVERVLGKKSGVYVLIRGNEPYYVGLASELRHRLPKHREDRLAGKWDRFSFYAMKTKYIKDVETLLIRLIDPDGNKTGGNFDWHRNLKKRIKKEIKKEFNRLLGKN